MTAYWVSNYLEINDPEKMSAYAELAGPAIRGAGGTFLTRSVAAHAYEAGRLQRTVVVEFPTLDAAVAAHESPAYQEALAALDDGAVRDLRIVEGVEPATPVDHP